MGREIKNSVDNCLNWIQTQMLSFNNGSWGVFERIRTDINERVCLSRPDVASEYLRALHLYGKTYSDDRYAKVYENVLRWLLYAQNSAGNEGNAGFPFSLVDGNKRYPSERVLYQNDNGKILINLLYLYEKTADERLRAAAERLADFWLSIQTEEGIFHSESINELQPFPKAPCFVLWLMAGLFYAHRIFKREEYLTGGKKALSYILNIIESGRLKTSYELTGTEFWRPVSSENFIALYCLSLCRGDDERLDGAIAAIYPFCRSLIDKSGAVRNCNKNTQNAAQECNEYLADLVYTQGYALNALIELHEATHSAESLNHAKKLADWLMSIQIKEEGPLTNGAWRGSYNLRQSKYGGRCNNAMEEGGEFSVYTGWCALPNIIGFLRLQNMVQ